MPKQFEKFRGLNNVAADTSLSTRELREATNVDLTDRGQLRRRYGYSLVQAGDFHSLWADDDGAYVVYNDALCSINSDLSLTTLHSGLRPNTRMTYVRVAGDVYYSDGYITGKIKNGVARPWGVEVPISPGLIAISGALSAGQYQVKLTFVNDMGEESGASKSSELELSTTGGIQVNLPSAVDSTVEGVAVYITPTNGGEFYYVTTVSEGTTSVNVTGGTYAYPLRTEFLSPPKPGAIIGSYGGRIYYIAGGVVWYTEAYEYGRVKEASNYIQMPNAVVDGVVIGQSMYISDGKTTAHISGEPGNMSEVTASPTGMIVGTPTTLRGSLIGDEDSDNYVAVWMSDHGFMVGTADGNITGLTRERVSFAVGNYGASQVIARNGVNQLLTVLKEPSDETSNVAFGDRVTAEVRRNGVVIN